MDKQIYDPMSWRQTQILLARNNRAPTRNRTSRQDEERKKEKGLWIPWGLASANHPRRWGVTLPPTAHVEYSSHLGSQGLSAQLSYSQEHPQMLCGSSLAKLECCAPIELAHTQRRPAPSSH